MNRKVGISFTFPERRRSQLTFSDPTKIRLDPADGCIKLTPYDIYVPTGDQLYTAESDLYVTTWEINPTALRQWVGFHMEPWTTEQPAGTSVTFKLNDGLGDKYWDGVDWEAAGADDWNTEAEVAANISTFPVTEKKLRLVIKLETEDRFTTPSIAGVQLMAICDFDHFHSVVAGVIVPSLKSVLRPSVDIAVQAPGGTSVSIKEYASEYNIVSVDGVFDHTSDQDHLTSLYSSYDNTAGVLTMSAPVERGHVLWLDLTVEPEVYVNWAHQDYVEVERLPAVVVDSFYLTGSEVEATTKARDVSNSIGLVQRAPLRLQMLFDVVLIAKRTRTLLAMMDRILEYSGLAKMLPWPAIADEVVVSLVEKGTSMTAQAELSDKHSGRYTMKIDNLYFWTQEPETLPFVQQANFSIVVPSLEGGVRRLR